MKKTNKQYNKHNSAFTIVELLIVIVVIAILAAITVVAYNGIQTRAYNAATISQAKQVVDLVNAYVAVEGKYPLTANACATIDGECTFLDGTVTPSTHNATLINNLSTIGTPASNRVSGEAAGMYGIRYNWWTGQKWNNGDIQPVAIIFYLKGASQKCSLPNVIGDNINGIGMPSTTGYTNTGTGYTVCNVHIDGPTL